MTDASPTLIDGVDIGSPVDGRTQRKLDNRTLALNTARDMICAGKWRPSMLDVAQTARLSPRSVFSYFGTIESLLDEVCRYHGASIYAALAEHASSPTQDMEEHRAKLIRIVLLGRP